MVKSLYLIATPSTFEICRCADGFCSEYSQAINPDEGDIIGFVETEQQAQKLLKGRAAYRYYEIKLLDV